MTQSNHDDDRRLGMDRAISRRDFLNGLAVGLGTLGAGVAGPSQAAGQSAALSQDTPGYYPPALTGMRGSHDGSFDVSHALRDGRFWPLAPSPVATGERYDLVVIGGGISGLAAAWFYRARAGRGARILILDNHDDFGGHAKRNEFRPGGRLLIANGGTQSIESPFPFSAEARGLVEALGVDVPALEAAAERDSDRSVYQSLQPAWFFDRETFGTDRLVVGAPGRPGERGEAPASSWSAWLARTPLPAGAQRDIARLQEAAVDYMPGLSSDQKKDRLSRISYERFLLDYVKVVPEVIPFYQQRTHGLYGVGIDAVGALECWAYGYPGFRGLRLDEQATGRMSFTARGEATPKPAYEFHFPDGNASLARLLVRALIPEALPGSTAADVVTAVADYSRLDRAGAPVRIRLGSTAARVRHVGDPSRASEVEVVYGRAGRTSAVRASAVVMACWNSMIPYLVEDLPADQKAALGYGVKVPLVYTTVALRNWRAFATLGVRTITTPGGYHTGMQLELPTPIGDYRPGPRTPDDPVLVRMTRTPCRPGLPARDQHRAGHADLYATPFSTFERRIRDQFARALGPGGFDPARDIDAITVNRWPHGYAYEYNPLWDPDWPPGQAPCEIGRRRFGRIAIANSDAAAAAYTDQAIDQAYRAVEELLPRRA